MNYTDVVRKLIGPIKPIGKTEVDDERFENLKSLASLIENLLLDIDDLAFDHKNAQEFSIKRSVDYSNNFIKSIKTELLE
jgi:hypothetical protein